MEKIFKVGIIGAGHIACKAAYTVNRMDGFEMYAVASRSLGKAEAFARDNNVRKAYGSYDELIADPEVDMLYIATPHSHHFDVTIQALAAGKPCLVEKAFMANARQAQAVIDLAREKNVYVAEAIWTRYEPAVKIVNDIIASGEIGKVQFMTGDLCYPVSDKDRIKYPELCGGSLLDLGVYVINFAKMFHPARILSTTSSSVNSDLGIDLQNSFTFIFEDGVMASLFSSASCVSSNNSMICGDKAYITFDDVNNPQVIGIYLRGRKLVREIRVPEQITGFEYEFQAAKDNILAGRIEPKEMPHEETLEVMRIMDGLRAQWGVRFPMD